MNLGTNFISCKKPAIFIVLLVIALCFTFCKSSKHNNRSKLNYKYKSASGNAFYKSAPRNSKLKKTYRASKKKDSDNTNPDDYAKYDRTISEDQVTVTEDRILTDPVPVYELTEKVVLPAEPVYTDDQVKRQREAIDQTTDTQSRVPIQYDELDRLFEDFETANIVFNVPSTVNINDLLIVQLELSMTENFEKLKELIKQEGAIDSATIKISKIMLAKLVGNMFEISPIYEEEQAIKKYEPNEWKWELKPKSQGNYKLHLTLTAIVEIDGKTTTHGIKTFEREIQVEVLPTQQFLVFIQDNWQWIWAAILVPAAGLYWRNRKINV